MINLLDYIVYFFIFVALLCVIKATIILGFKETFPAILMFAAIALAMKEEEE